MTNNHCPDPEDIRPVISVETQNKITEFAQYISEKVYEFCEEESFNSVSELPENWMDCRNCEKQVLNAQEKALSVIENALLAAIKQNGVF